jgi:hypothetical protein
MGGRDMNGEHEGSASGSKGTGLSEQEADFLISQYEEHCEHGRHCEAERSTLTTLVLAAQAAVFTYLGTKEFNCKYRVVEWLIPAFSVYGFVAALSLYRRIDWHHKFIVAFRVELENRLPGARVREIRKDAKGGKKRDYDPNAFWHGLHLAIGVLALVAILIFRCDSESVIGKDGHSGEGASVQPAPVAVTIENNPVVSVGPQAASRASIPQKPTCPCTVPDPVTACVPSDASCDRATGRR